MAFIQHKRSSVPGLVPIAGELLDGEIALNTADGKAFIKKSSGTVIQINPSNTGAIQNKPNS